MKTYAQDMVHKKTMEMYKKDWDKICPDTSCPESLYAFARGMDYEFLMYWLPRYVPKFKAENDTVISDREAFYKRFSEFATAVYETDIKKGESKYLLEMMEGKYLWTIDGECDDPERTSPITVKGGVLSIPKQGITRFWKNYMTTADKQRKIEKQEEVYWLILAWVYINGNFEENVPARNQLDIMKRIMCNHSKDNNMNKVVSWCIGCYVEMFLESNIQEKGSETKRRLIENFGYYEYMGGVFKFSESFGYKEKHIEEQLALILIKALSKDVQGCLAGYWCDLVPYVDRNLQMNSESGQAEDDILKGMQYPISKPDRKPKHEGEPADASEYMEGTKNGLKEYFNHNHIPMVSLDMPEFRELNAVLNKETIEIMTDNHRMLISYLYKKLLCSVFVRMWPSKKTYLSMREVQYALEIIEKNVCIPVNKDRLEMSENVMGIYTNLVQICEKNGKEIIKKGDGEEKRFEKMLNMILPFFDEYDENCDDKEDDDNEGESLDDYHRKIEVLKIVIHDCIANVIYLKKISPSQMLNTFRRMEENLKFDTEMAVALLVSMFELYS